MKNLLTLAKLLTIDVVVNSKVPKDLKGPDHETYEDFENNEKWNYTQRT